MSFNALSETTGRTAENATGPIRYKRRRGYYLAADPLQLMQVSTAKIPSPEKQLEYLQKNGPMSNSIFTVPPGLTLSDERSLDKLKQKPHIGALWSAVSRVT